MIDIYMKKLLKKLQKLFKQKKGFTLIELLVVIGILGILAAALVATIDPFEQLNKAQDANTKNILVEYLNANVRFYANHTAYPWDNSVPDACNSTNPPANLVLCSGVSPCSVSDCVAKLISESELKPSFESATGNLAQIHITYWGDTANPPAPSLSENTDSLVGCFVPKSKSGQKDPAVHWDATGDVDQGSACISQGGTTACYWCTK
jgi:prepilin-type N-terminal cleavage/methylation domain-containing protein